MSKNIGISPLGNRVVVRPSAPEKVTQSGIIIPDTTSKEKPAQGEVLAVGPGSYDDGKLVPMQVNVGDTVLFAKYSPEEVEVDGEQYFILREDSLLAIITKN